MRPFKGLAIIALASCMTLSTANAQTEEEQGQLEALSDQAVALDDSYLLGPGDVLGIVVFNHEDLSGDFVVSNAGIVSLPLIGEIRALGRTINAVRQDYSDLLANGFLVNPNISANISQYRPFFIVGGVRQPGAYPYQSGMSILHAIALAGSYSKPANRNIPPILKRTSGAPVSGETVSVHTPVFPGDLVEIPVCRALGHDGRCSFISLEK